MLYLTTFICRYASDGEEQPVLESMRDYLIGTIQKTFEVGLDQSEKLYQELLQCTRNKNLVSRVGNYLSMYVNKVMRSSLRVQIS